jgi:hypothetical protein
MGERERAAEAPSKPKQFTIAQFMVVVAALAVLLAIPLDPLVRAIVIVLGSVVIFPMLAYFRLFDLIMGARCDRCYQGILRRVAVYSFGYRFYRCEACGARYKRGVLGFWHDASAQRDDGAYRRAIEFDPWSSGPELLQSDEAFSGTHGTLLANKQRRAHADAGRDKIDRTEKPDNERGVL